ncbi:MAG: YwbE family protein [Patescibacteria group bacterium]
MVPARKEIKIGQRVWAIEKRNYGTDDLTEGIVQQILTSAPFHPRGIKVMFGDGTVARVQRLTPPEKKVETEPNPPTAEDLR